MGWLVQITSHLHLAVPTVAMSEYKSGLLDFGRSMGSTEGHCS